MNEPRIEAPTEPEPAQLDAVCRAAVAMVSQVRGPLRRMSLRRGEVAIEMEWPEHGTTPTTVDTGVPEQPDAEAGWVEIRAPMVGTFYHASEPGGRPFVAAGEVVESGQQVGILEAMKLMNAIEADRVGRVVEVLVPDGTPVEYDQPLIALVPLEGN